MPSFLGTTPDRSRADDLMGDYLRFLAERNGRLEGADGFGLRDEMMAGMDDVDVMFSGHMDSERFNRNYAHLTDRDLSPEELALLALVKMNAGEAYGVEVTTVARAKLQARDEPLFRVERILGREETYHTRMLVGTTNHFAGLTVEGAWSPAWPLRLLIFCLAKFPASLFHPVLLGAEVSGVYNFNWMLSRVGSLFPNDPGVRESIERRLIEILIDEVGHVAFNRVAILPGAMRVVPTLAAAVGEGIEVLVPELVALGFDREARRGLARFDYRDLPEEVRRRSFFV